MLIILSPAKTMDMTTAPSLPATTSPIFNADAELLAQKMKQYSADDLARLLKISPVLAQTNYVRYQQFGDSHTPCKPALFAYDGSVFKAIAPADFTAADLQYAQDRIRIISTLYGLVRPLDTIKAYRIAYALRIDGIMGNLYNYWIDKLTDPLIQDTQKVGGILVNLASIDIQAALNMTELRDEITVITPEFKEMRHGKYETVRTYSKIARGAMTRFIIKERIETPETLTAFEWKGYQFNALLSDEKNYIYTRE